MTEDKVTPPSNPEVVDIDGCAALYVELRDTIAAIKAEMIERTKPYRKGLDDLDAILLKALQDQGVKSMRTPSGTVYQRVEASATIKDRKMFKDFVIDNGQWDLLDWKANKPAVRKYMEEQQADVPGLNFTASMTIGVRRGNSTQEDE